MQALILVPIGSTEVETPGITIGKEILVSNLSKKVTLTDTLDAEEKPGKRVKDQCRIQ